jgi:hypothetical protein
VYNGATPAAGLARLESEAGVGQTPRESTTMSPRALLASCWTLVILVLCWLPPTMLPEEEKGSKRFLIPHFDKLIHMGIFAVFAFLWMRVGDSPRRGRWVLLAGLALAVLSELGQEVPIVSRDASVADALADGLGVVASVIGYEVARKLLPRRAVPTEA